MDDILIKSRDRIDEIDEKIIELFEERMEVVLNVAKYKKENSLPIFNRQREEAVIEKNVNRLKNKELSRYAQEMIHCLMDVSKEYQSSKIGLRETPLCKGKEIKVGFQGTRGSFSEEALIKYFGDGCSLRDYGEFENVFQALKQKEINYGVLPIENSSTGSITEIYDLLKKYGYYIVGETKIKIEHNLLGVEGSKIEDIKEVYSHEQGFKQSNEFIKGLNGVEIIPYHNTATSAQYVSDSKDKRKAAIGSKRAADIYGLKVLKASINNEHENYTKFVIIGRNLEFNDLSNKITMVFTLENKLGTLYAELKLLSEAGINMSKIESRPVGNGSFSYFFYIDIDGNLKDKNIKEIIENISENTEEFKMLGNYKKA